MKWFLWHILITGFWRWTIILCCLHYRWTSLIPTNPWCLRWRWNLEEIFLLEEFDGTYRSNFRSIHGKFHFALFSCFISSKNIHVDVFHKKYTSEKKTEFHTLMSHHRTITYCHNPKLLDYRELTKLVKHHTLDIYLIYATTLWNLHPWYRKVTYLSLNILKCLLSPNSSFLTKPPTEK